MQLDKHVMNLDVTGDHPKQKDKITRLSDIFDCNEDPETMQVSLRHLESSMSAKKTAKAPNLIDSGPVSKSG